MPITLNAHQLEALHQVKLGQNIFLTGSSGVGKSTCLKQIIEWARESQINVGVTASTGAAAFLINGRTLHSFLGIGLGNGSASSLASKTLSKNEIVYDRIRFLKLLIIDEISMIGSELFTKISEYLSIIKNNPKPFGGIQIILSGDFCQLPPVNGEYCFISSTWSKAKIETIMLVELIRQQDDIEFQNILQELRWGVCTENTLEILQNLKYTEFPEDIIPTKLYSTNVNVDKINQSEFDKLIKLGAVKKIYKNKYSTHPDTKTWSDSLKQPKYVELCIGAQIMVTYNIDEFIINGTRGIIVSMNTNTVNIKLVNNNIVIIPYVKILSSDNDKIFLSFMPLKLAYALSIHRCQGSTLDAIEIDIGRTIFEFGQAYVCISRARSLSSIKIINVESKSFKTHPLVKQFYNYE
jgi:ATP-dependent exoDNAse (exonuclease V) alpha subunit